MGEFSDNLRALRAFKNMSQDELANSLHVDRKTVCNWENGSTIPNVEMARRIAVFFSVTLDDLAGRELIPTN